VIIRLQRSANLVDWEEWQTISLGDSPAETLDETSVPQRFYRAVEDGSGP